MTTPARSLTDELLTIARPTVQPTPDTLRADLANALQMIDTAVPFDAEAMEAVRARLRSALWKVDADTRAHRQTAIGYQQEIAGLKDDLRIAMNLAQDIKDLAARLESHTLGR